MLLRAIDRKMLRDLWGIRGQAAAICLVMAAGVATFVMSLSTLLSLRDSRDAYYQSARFAEIFMHLKRMPLSLVPRLEEIPGVREVYPRIMTEVSLDLPDLSEPAIGRLISVPSDPSSGLNLVRLMEGRPLDANNDREVLVSQAFAEAHQLHPGDGVQLVLNGRRRRLVIAGIVLSPEFLIQIREGSLLPDDLRYGVFWMPYRHLAAALNMEGATNDICMSLWPGADEGEVLARVDRLTEPYGGTGAFARADQISHNYITQEIQQLTSMGLMVPSIFLGVAAFLMHVVISRLLSIQREQVAAMRAFGYSRVAVGVHYLKLVMFLVLVGVVVGAIVGAKLGSGLTGLYSRFYRFPTFAYRCDSAILALSFGVAAGAGFLGTVAAVWRAMWLPPAEAMRPEPPARFRPTLIERIGLGGLFPLSVRMILRQLERRPTQSAFSCMGIALAVSVLILGSFSADAVRHVIDYQFHWTQRQDLTVTFFEPRAARSGHDLAGLRGVLRCEPFRAVPCRLRAGHRSRRVAIQGLPDASDLYLLRNLHGTPVSPPLDGLFLADKLAELLDVEVGDSVWVEAMEGKRMQRLVPVRGLLREYGGLNAYIRRETLQRWMEEEGSVSGAFLRVDAAERDALYARLKRIPAVASVTIRQAAIDSFNQTVAENLMTIRLYNMIFASIIAFGIVYNGARVSFSERSREFASLRVMGFTRGEVSWLLLGELAILTAVAIPLGLLIGYGLAAWAVTGMDTELFRIPLVVDRVTFGMAAAVTLVASVLSGLVVRARVDGLDLIAVLKTRE